MNFSMPVRYMQAHSNVRESDGQLALMRGPLVYCLEEKDNGPNLHLLRCNPHGETKVIEQSICDEKVISRGENEMRVWVNSLPFTVL